MVVVGGMMYAMYDEDDVEDVDGGVLGSNVEVEDNNSGGGGG